jgi:hypothetical protein
LNQLCLYYDVQEGYVQIGCDGLSALQNAFDKGPLLPTDYPDYDLFKENLQVSWTHKHVKGHQDDLSEDLDQWVLLNVQMDKIAQQFLQQAVVSSRHYDIKGELWQLWVKGSKITTNLQQYLYEAVQSGTSEEYWASKPNTSTESIKSVDWRTIGSAMKTQPRARRVFFSKHIAGMCGVGKFMKWWKEWESDICPRCGSPEDAPHVWLCKGPGTEELWSKAVVKLKGVMRRLDTGPHY